jgi:gamma-glutamyl-gamma-aminobutyraldehyde dehydrogenase
MTLQKNLHRAASLRFPTEAVIDGRQVAAVSGKTLANVGPRDGKRLADVAACDAADIDAAVKAARAAFEDGRWRNKQPREKKRIMFRLAELMERDLEELALLWDACDIAVPFGGAKQSGCDRSLHAMEKHTELKGVSITYLP